MMQVIHTLFTHFIPWVFALALVLTIICGAILIVNVNKYQNPSPPRLLLLFALIGLTMISLMVVMAQIFSLADVYKEILEDIIRTLIFHTDMLGETHSALGAGLWLLIWGGPVVYGGLLCAVLLCACLLFFATRLCLNRKPKELGFAAHRDLALGKVLWLNMLFIVVFVLFFVLCFCVFELIFWLAMPAIFDEPSRSSVNDFTTGQAPWSLYSYSAPSFLESKTARAASWFFYSLGLSAGILLVIFGSFVVKSLLLSRHSIDRLAKTLKAIEITPKKYKNHHRYKQLLNVVEEIAIASAMPMPRVFIMRQEQGINAMCSGERFGKSDERFALFFTQGALDKLSREELSGVVGHEFSHAFHQDVALNLRIFSLIFGFMSISFIGEILMHSIARRTRSAGKRDSKGEAVIALFAFSFYALGLLGTLCASLIQAAISRQKEFLADATSVQYTHNPNAILRALQTIAQEESPKESQERKLAKDTQGFLHNKLAKPCAHMFFLQGFKGIFATHPPIHKRIEALESIAR